MYGTRIGALLLALAFMLAPSSAQAGSGIAAGIAPGPVWLSDSTPAAGDRVALFTVAYDSSAVAIEGSVSFLIDGVAIGSIPFELDPGETKVASVAWTAVEGNHTAEAVVETVIDQDSKQVQTLERKTTGTIPVSVLAAKKAAAPSAPAQAAVVSGAALISTIASSSPIAATVVTTAEEIRKAGESYLLDQSGNPAGNALRASSTKASGEVLGAETEDAADGTDVSTTSPNETNSIKERVAVALLPLFQYPAIFYPFFLILLGIAFFVIAKRLRNPKRSRR